MSEMTGSQLKRYLDALGKTLEDLERDFSTHQKGAKDKDQLGKHIATLHDGAEFISATDFDGNLPLVPSKHKRLRDCAMQATELGDQSEEVLDKSDFYKDEKGEAARREIERGTRAVFKAATKLLAGLAALDEETGLVRTEQALGGIDKSLRAQANALKARQAPKEDALREIADHVASFAPVTGYGMALQPGGAAQGIETRRAEGVLAKLLGTALPEAGKSVGPSFAEALTDSLDQRLEPVGNGFKVISGTARSIGPSTPPRGSQASLLREVESHGESFLRIARELRPKARDPDQDAIADHRARLVRYVENLFALTAFESGPVLSRALFQVKAIRREWTGLKRELGVLEPMALKRSIAHKAGLDIRALEIAEGEEIDSEARRAEAYLDLIAGAYDTWAQHSQDSLGAKAARLLQNVRSLNESARQLEAAFDLAEIGPDDRRSRRFGNANVSLQGFLEWIVEDSRQWIDELADGDTRGTVAKVIVEGAEIQSGVLDELKDYVEHNGIVGKARVLRAIGELHENLDRIQQQELPTF